MINIDLNGKKGIVFGVANHRSIAWAISQKLLDAGAEVTIAYQSERFKSGVEKLIDGYSNASLEECDVSSDDSVSNLFANLKDKYKNIDFLVHSIAFAPREDLAGEFDEISRENFNIALEISSFSLITLVNNATKLMNDGGSILALTFQASQSVYPGYNIMGVAKAALENEVKQLAAEYGSREIRVNALSPGPMDTLAARGIHGFIDMKKIHAAKAPLKRNITHDEVGNAALFLCSDLATGITGTILPVDAGYHIMAV
ncbi:MAG: enoyl-ACP reductase [SAR202 cluster bacterium]|jgi:enoyl-[acyl-carrier protein] reductase I|nr:enoyl-[acyl-carrier-protein] reductase FabI [Chloroflexota bacterium]MQG50390.1 enoyl-ACP reductase [SAR202 cluster bacterium]|tara:strand:- start:3241 stop:4014 length:774 start_codon:yes stop_codon:yes gene_type:complete